MSYRAQLLAACLHAGADAVVSHRAAAHLWGLLLEEGPVEITVPYPQCPTPRGVVVHRSSDLVPAQVIRRHQLPVTKPARTLADLGAVASLADLTAAVDAAVVKGLLSYEALHAVTGELGRNGRTGIGALRGVLDDRPFGDRRPESVLEPVMGRICRTFGIEHVHYQYPITVGAKHYRVDFGVPHVRFGIEVDGLEVHGTRTAAIRDRVRRRDLRSVGWDLAEYTAAEILRRPATVAKEITAEIRRREKTLDALALRPSTLL